MSEGSIMTEAVEILVELLRPSGNRGRPLTVVRSKLEELLRADGFENPSAIAEQAIQHALEKWAVDKTVDEPEPEDKVPDSGEVWFLRALSPQESAVLQKLPEVEQAVLRILWNRDLGADLGAMRADDLLDELLKGGFGIDEVPIVVDRVQKFSTVDKDGRIEYWYGLIPRYEQTEEFKASMEEATEKLMEREWREDRAIAREEAQERRKAARKKKATVEKKKASTNRKPE